MSVELWRFMFKKKYKIGNLVVEITSNKKFTQELLSEQNFLTAYNKVDIQINCLFTSREEFIKNCELNRQKIIGHPNTHNFWFSEKDNLSVFKNFVKKKVEIVAASSRININGYVFRMEDQIRANLSLLIGQLSIAYDSILLHGAGLIRKGKAYIFLARDDGGKTTLIKQQMDMKILNDDRIFYSSQENKTILAHSNPFGTIKQSDLYAPIAAFFVIVKSNKFSLKQGWNKHLIASFWQDNAELLESLPKDFRKKAFIILAKIAQSAPAFELHTHYGKINWNQIDEALNNT